MLLSENINVCSLYNLLKEKKFSLTQLTYQASIHLERFACLIYRHLAEKYIDIPPSIALVSHPSEQRLTLANQHPQCEEICRWLKGDNDIYQGFKELELIHEFIEAIRINDDSIDKRLVFHIGLTGAGAIAYFDQLMVDSMIF